VLVEAWQLPIGVIIILIILFFPKGIVGEIKSKVLKNDTEMKNTDDQGGVK
jgi:ABC-type branched-subunit amino acid transport system permease subunit